jgi:hypothetical protein
LRPRAAGFWLRPIVIEFARGALIAWQIPRDVSDLSARIAVPSEGCGLMPSEQQMNVVILAPF